MLSRLTSKSPSDHPGLPPDDSRQEANISRFMDRSEAQMRSVVNHPLRLVSAAFLAQNLTWPKDKAAATKLSGRGRFSNAEVPFTFRRE